MIVILLGTQKYSFHRLLEEVQRKVPDIVLPSMGIIDNEVKIDIHGSDYIKKEND